MAPELIPTMLLRFARAACQPALTLMVGTTTFTESDKIFRYRDIEKNIKENNKLWVIKANGVYDVTAFVRNHPGGNKILLAAGKDIEPFWAVYTCHNTAST